MSALEEDFLGSLRILSLPLPEREHAFHASRRWRFDFAWPDRLLAVELEGGSWVGGRHGRGAGTAKDCEKYNAAATDGWAVLRFTTDMVRSGQAVETTILALGLFARRAGPAG